MASSKQYLAFILDQFSGLEGITCRPMMGEYLLYYQGKLFGGIYDDRLLVKNIQSARSQGNAFGYRRGRQGAFIAACEGNVG